MNPSVNPEEFDRRAAFRQALSIGLLCVFSYLVSYYSRSLLSVTKNQMDCFSEAEVTLFSSLYMLVYAAGQLLNGLAGDYIKPRKMIGIGLLITGVSTVGFSFVGSAWLGLLCFGCLGFGLSMLRGPMMKIISENTIPNHARTICVFFSVVSFAGPLIASLFVMLLPWRAVYTAGGSIALAVAAADWLILCRMEKRGMIRESEKKPGAGLHGLLGVFKVENFAMFLIVACIVEIAGISISFWLTTFFAEYLHFDNDASNFVFSAVSIFRSLMPFAALFLFNRFGKKDMPLMIAFFTVAGVLCLAVLAVPGTWTKIVLLLLSLMAESGASAVLWSIYIPSLGKTGRVSGMNGILDCAGYIAASVATVLFKAIKDSLSWSGVIVIWAGIFFAGTLTVLLFRVLGKKKT